MLRSYRPLIPYLKKYRLYYIFGVLSLVLTSGAQLFIPMFVRDVLDLVSSGNFELTEVLGPLASMLGVAVLVALGRFGWRFWLHGAARRIETEFRSELFQKLTRLGDSFYGTQKVGDLLARATNDMQAVRMASSMGLVAFFDGLFMTIAIIIILFQQNSKLAALIILPLPIVTALVLGLGKLVGKLFKQVQEGFSELSHESQEVFSNIKIVKSFVLEKYFLRRFGDTNLAYQKKNLQLVQVWGFMFPFVGFLSGITTVLLLIFGGREVIIGSLTPGEFVATLAYLQMLIWPMLGAGFTVNVLQRGAASMRRISDILNGADEFPLPLPETRAVAPSTSISFEGISVRYGTQTVLDRIDLEIPSGSILGIIGPTGSGKTTLVRLLLRLVEPSQGRLLFDGRDIRELNPQSLRELFAYVPQDGFLFSETVRNNIAFGLDDPDSDQAEVKVKDMVVQAALTRDLELFPLGLETQIGERGITVSGGQKQRIALARALAKEARILIIDDGLSALDASTEDEVLGNILRLRKGRTTFLVSHRVSALKHADMTIVLEDGTISARGTHEELMATPGFYRSVGLLQRAEEAKHL